VTSTTDRPYATGLTRSNVERALAQAGKQTDALRPSDLAMLEDFHSLGRHATTALIDLAHISANERVLDAGAGIGGTALADLLTWEESTFVANPAIARQFSPLFTQQSLVRPSTIGPLRSLVGNLFAAVGDDGARVPELRSVLPRGGVHAL